MPVATFLAWTFKAASAAVRVACRQLVLFLALMLERGAWLEAASRDPLDAALPVASVKRRRISREVKDRVAEAGSEGQLGQSGRQVLQIMGRWGRWQQQAFKTANSFLPGRVAAYWQAGQEAFRAGGGPVLSLSWDATRAGGKEMLFSCIWSPALQKGMWLPPQVVLPSSTPPQTWAPAPRRKPPQAPPETAASMPTSM